MGGESKVLVIEDEEHIREVLGYNLRIQGFEVYLAEDGLTGLRLAREIKPDVILLDWMMPDMDGLAVLAEIKNDEAMKDTRVFMVTANGMPSDRDLALSVGADYYIVKPFDTKLLSKMIRQEQPEGGRAGRRQRARIGCGPE